jgi:hypothetical protein
MRIGVEPMAGSELANAQERTGLGCSLIKFVLQPTPSRFNITTFAKRTCQNLIIYFGLLVAALYACLLILAPIETLILSVICIALAGIGISFLSSSLQKLHRLVEGALAAGYIAGAAALLKAFEAFLHRM